MIRHELSIDFTVCVCYIFSDRYFPEKHGDRHNVIIREVLPFVWFIAIYLIWWCFRLPFEMMM